jgi:hypothetical protein
MIAKREAEKCILEFARLFPGWLLVFKRLDHGSTTPPDRFVMGCWNQLKYPYAKTPISGN